MEFSIARRNESPRLWEPPGPPGLEIVRVGGHLPAVDDVVDAPRAAAEFAIIAPTYNESGNLEELVERIDGALVGVSWELIVVDDDSPDMTAAHAIALHQRDPRVRVLRRIGRRGLSSACIEGMLATCAPYLAVMDADLQHDPALLALMLQRLRAGEVDLVVGSRYVPGGDVGDWQASRRGLSRLATAVTSVLPKVRVADPMSGYFALRREVLDQTVRDLSGLGFKILLDILLTAPASLRVVELPFTFGVRTRGESKLSASVLWECGLLVVDKTVGRYVPARFIAFGLVGLTGVVLHFMVLTGLYRGLGVAFGRAQLAATLVAAVSNFSINNLLTYAGALKGWKWLRGLASFSLISGLGAVANVAVATLLFNQHISWPLAALAGIAASSVWNYVVSARYTWGRARG